MWFWWNLKNLGHVPSKTKKINSKFRKYDIEKLTKFEWISFRLLLDRRKKWTQISGFFFHWDGVLRGMWNVNLLHTRTAYSSLMFPNTFWMILLTESSSKLRTCDPDAGYRRCPRANKTHLSSIFFRKSGRIVVIWERCLWYSSAKSVRREVYPHDSAVSLRRLRIGLSSNKMWKISVSPNRTAFMSGVLPLKAVASTSAPYSSRIRVHSTYSYKRSKLASLLHACLYVRTVFQQ